MDKVNESTQTSFYLKVILTKEPSLQKLFNMSRWMARNWTKELIGTIMFTLANILRQWKEQVRLSSKQDVMMI